MNAEAITINDEFITLSQLLKITNHFDSGGSIKFHIQNEGVYVNDELEHRRGKKLYHNDVVKLKSGEVFTIRKKA